MKQQDTEEIEMKKLMFVAFVVATMFAAKSGAQAYVDGGLNCSSTSLVICAKLDQAGGTVLATNGERGDYVRMACPQGFGPQCIPVTDAERLCRERGPRFFWNRRNHRSNFSAAMAVRFTGIPGLSK